MLSMTGYGKGVYDNNEIELTCEIKTVNNRYLDVSIKSPRVFSSCDDLIRSTIKEKLTRGHADVYISLKDKREKEATLTVDTALALSYFKAGQTLKAQIPELPDDITLTSVLRYPDVLKQEDGVALDELLITALKSALNSALDNLNEMRLIEGEKLKADMLSRVAFIEKTVEEISLRAPEIAKAYKDKLTARVQEY